MSYFSEIAPNGTVAEPIKSQENEQNQKPLNSALDNADEKTSQYASKQPAQFHEVGMMYPAAVIAHDAPDNTVVNIGGDAENPDSEIMVISSDSDSDGKPTKDVKRTITNSSSSDDDFPARATRFRKNGGPKWKKSKSYIFNSDTSDECDTDQVNLTSSHGGFVVGSDVSSDEEPNGSDVDFVDDTADNTNADSHRAFFNKLAAEDDELDGQYATRYFCSRPYIFTTIYVRRHHYVNI